MEHTDETPERAFRDENRLDDAVNGPAAGDPVPEPEASADKRTAGTAANASTPSRGGRRRKRQNVADPAAVGTGDLRENAGGRRDGDDLPAGEDPVDEELEAIRAGEALYGRKLKKIGDRVHRWRKRQAKEAFQIGDLWADMTERLSAKEISAFLASECQIPRRDVSRYVRLVKILGNERAFYIDSGVAVSVLLDLAGQKEAVREEADRMIRSGRALQDKELRALKRDIGLARAAAEGKIDESRKREFRETAARKARAAADAWLASLEKFILAADKVSDFDKFEGNTLRQSPKKIDQLASRAGKLIEELPAIVGKEFAKAPVATDRYGYQVSGGSWPKVFETLRDMSKRKMFDIAYYERPETTVYDSEIDLPHVLSSPVRKTRTLNFKKLISAQHHDQEERESVNASP